MNKVIFSVLAVLLAISASAQDLTDSQRAAIEERIHPVGQSCMEGGDGCGGAVAVAAVASSGPRSGEEVYNSACLACHSTGAAGAPIYGVAANWTDRIAKGNAVLYTSGIEGIAGTGMIAKGGCMSCSNAEIEAAVDYMVAGSK
jgi:cytochrome c5|tara:strand:+ start:97340 stop:97771 length:432 start_codon:yes stop_codon:yes gene_type:complete